MTTDLNGFRKDRVGAVIDKDPQATLDYSVDWSDWVSAGDVITSSIWTISTITGDTAPVEEEDTNLGSNIATVWLSGGTVDKIYTITNTITTDNGLIDERFFRLKIKNKSA